MSAATAFSYALLGLVAVGLLAALVRWLANALIRHNDTPAERRPDPADEWGPRRDV